jgi:hypothetical protein
MARVYSETSDVTNNKGVVMVDGPDGVAISLTPEAAAKIGADLLDNAAEAKGEAEIDAARKSSR